MIAIARAESPQVSPRTRREEIYALRRLLVRQLQARTSRVPHAVRYESHRRFIREWEEMQDTGAWGRLHAALAGSAGPVPGLLGELALAARASEGVVPRESRLGLDSRPGLDCGDSRPIREGFLAACREADLFSRPVARSA